MTWRIESSDGWLIYTCGKCGMQFSRTDPDSTRVPNRIQRESDRDFHDMLVWHEHWGCK